MSRNTCEKTRMHRSLRLETVEKRELMAADMTGSVLQNQPPIEISAQEQLVLELVNRARANPTAESARLGIELNQGLSNSAISATPKQPLTPNAALNRAATAHTQSMLAENFFDHTGRDGSTPYDRAKRAGYPTGAAENIAVRSYWANQVDEAVAASHDMLFRSPGHRMNLMNDQMRDFGIGVATGNYTFTSGNYPVVMTTENFGRTTETSRSITGVIYSDKVVDDNFYTIGEGTANITVIAERSDGITFQTSTGISGGYSLKLPPGQYTLRAVDTANRQSADMGKVTLAENNVKVDATAEQFRAMPQNDDVTVVTPPDDSKFDCNSDGSVTPLDVLLTIEHISRPGANYDHAFDINDDSFVTPIDALLLIEHLNLSNRKGSVSAPVANSKIAGADVAGGESVVIDAELEKLKKDAVQQASQWFTSQLTTEVVRAKSVVWSNASLDLSTQPSLQVITPGYQIIVRHGTILLEYRAAKGGSIRYAGYANASDYLADSGRGCCPWDIDAPCLVAIDEAIKDLTENFHNSAN